MSLEEEFPSIAPEETVAAELPPAELPAVELPPATIPLDEAIQNELNKIADGVVVRNRFTVGTVTDTFISGGAYAPGRSRWVQTDAFASAESQARTLADSLL